MARKPHNKNIYTAFAEIYDQVMRNIEYAAWADHVQEMWKTHNHNPASVLNLACGTGCLEKILAKRGYSMTGIDIAEPMLEKARQRCRRINPPVTLVCSAMESFSFPGQQFDAVLCLYDSLNYLTQIKNVKRTFKSVFEHLAPGGLFIFDVTTEYNILTSYNGFTYAEDWGDGAYIWENHYQLADRICLSRFSFFLPQKGQKGANKQGGIYQRFVEDHYQKVYANWELEDLIQTTGFEFVGAYHGMTMEPVREDTERIHFVARKPADAR